MPFLRPSERLGTCLVAAVLAAASLPAGTKHGAPAPTKDRANELTLAGLRPGRDTRATALARYHKPWGASDEQTSTWRDLCRGRELRVDFGENDVVETVTVSVLSGPRYDCAPGTATMPADTWRTGHGLAIMEPRDRVVTLYGEPDSHGPSTRQSAESEFLYYAFDWAGSEVPQVLEVTCDHETGRVVQITLSAQSL